MLDPTLRDALRLVLEDHLEKAASVFAEWARTSPSNEALRLRERREAPHFQLSARLVRLDKDNARGLLTRERWLVERAEIRVALLDALRRAGGDALFFEPDAAEPEQANRFHPSSEIVIHVLSAPEDADMAVRLVKHLSPVLPNAEVVVGSPSWDDEASQGPAHASRAIVLVMLTADLLSNPDLSAVARRAMADPRRSTIPIIARPCAWANVSWLQGLEVTPRSGAPISSHAEPDAACAEIVVDLLTLVQRRETRT